MKKTGNKVYTESLYLGTPFLCLKGEKESCVIVTGLLTLDLPNKKLLVVPVTYNLYFF